VLADILLLILGIAALAYGARLAISAATDIAERTGIGRYGVGATIVATITSLPELAVGIASVVNGEPEIAIGTAVGSVVGLFLLSLGILALMTRIRFSKERKKEVLWAATIVTWATIAFATIRKINAPIGFLLVGVYLWYIHMVREGRLRRIDKTAEGRRVWQAIATLIFGIALVVGGAEAVVMGVTGLAGSFGLPEFLIAFFIVAIGTNLPELSVEIAAVRMKEAGIALGDLLGSAVADLTLVIGSTAIIGDFIGHPLVFNGSSSVTAAVMLGTALVGLKLSRDEEINRWEAVGLILIYALVVWAEVLASSL